MVAHVPAIAQFASSQLPEARPAGARWPLILAILLSGTGFLLIEQHRFDLYMGDPIETEVLESATETGSLFRQVGFGLVALTGVCLLAGRSQPRFAGLTLPAILFLGFIAWCVASTTWSSDVRLTMKRAGILLCCFVGAVGVGRRLSARELCLLTLAVTAAFTAIGLGFEVALGGFKPWSLGYRFAGVLHPNDQADKGAGMCLAGILLLGSMKRGRPLLLALIVVGLALLAITKSRTSCAALVVALLAVFVASGSWRWKVASGLAVGWMVGLLLLVGLMLGENQRIAETLALGRMEDVGTLTGRTELWSELLPFIEARPLLGYGYGAFWNAKNVADISETLFWGIAAAHSAYLEIVLNVGLIGAALLALPAVTATWRVAKLAHSGDPGNKFVFGLLICCAVTGLAEAGFAQPSFITWIAACALAQLTFFPLGESPASPRRMRVARADGALPPLAHAP